MHEMFTIQKSKREQVRICFNQYKGHSLLDVRIYEIQDNEYVPSKRGVTLNVKKTNELIEGLVHVRDEFHKGRLL